jgi:hypothetical protein
LLFFEVFLVAKGGTSREKDKTREGQVGRRVRLGGGFIMSLVRNLITVD